MLAGVLLSGLETGLNCRILISDSFYVTVLDGLLLRMWDYNADHGLGDTALLLACR